MSFIRKLKDGKSQVIKDIAFCTLLDGKLPDKNYSIIKLFLELDARVHETDNTVSKDAMNNVHGDWYEWLLAILAWNFCVENEEANFPFLTPNISQFDISRLYRDNLYDLIQDLREKVYISSAVKLISSNPDFVIIDRNLVNDLMPKFKKIEKIDQETILMIEGAYREFISRCNFDDILGYISVKTSFRPDRRLQIPHEGSLMKAIYTHLQTREWIISPRGLKYYAIATKLNKADQNALKTVATHSITTVHSLPQAAVDEVFQVNSLQDAEQAFSQILKL